MLAHYTDIMMLIIMFIHTWQGLWLRHLHASEWDVSLMKMQGDVSLMKMLGAATTLKFGGGGAVSSGLEDSRPFWKKGHFFKFFESLLWDTSEPLFPGYSSKRKVNTDRKPQHHFWSVLVKTDNLNLITSK